MSKPEDLSSSFPIPSSRDIEVDLVDRGIQTDSCGPIEFATARVLASQPLKNELRPHTITVLCIALALIWIGSTVKSDPILGFSNQTRGVFAAVSLFLVFATLQFPDGALVRPHPAVWRFIKGLSVLYLSLICFLLFQDVTDVRQWLKQIDPKLGVPLKEKDYATDCRLLTWNHPESIFANLKSRLDLFVVAHFGGWLVKALVIRDARLLWAMSILFEWMEITFRHILPNFWECWWDHLLLDVFGCNWLGILIGMRLVKWFEMEDYEWRWSFEGCLPSSVTHPIKTVSNDIDSSRSLQCPPEKHPGTIFLCSRRYVEALTPFQWTIYEWPSVLSSHEAFFGLIFFLFGVTFLDLNLFFLKAQLWLEPSHWILLLRTFLFVFVSASGTRDLYEYVTKPVGRRLGIQGWLGVAIILSEWMLAMKYWHALPSRSSMPNYIKIIWITFFTIVMCVGIRLFFKPQLNTSTPTQRWRKLSNGITPVTCTKYRVE